MDAINFILGVLTGVAALTLAFGTLAMRIRKWIKAVAREVLVESGLIKPNENQKNWPNGYDNLPDVLHELHEIMVEIRNGHER